jgi:hypothetical protein
VHVVHELFSFKENALNGFQVLLVHFEEDDVLLFKFIGNDGSSEDAFEVVE